MIDYSQLQKISPACPICNGDRFKVLAKNDRYGMRVQTVGCVQCGLVQTWPRPTPDAMAAFYRNSYRSYYQSASTPDSEYIRRFHKTERLRHTAEIIAEQIGLRKGMRVLDMGCAEGTLLLHLKTLMNGLVLVGVEPSPNFSAFARKVVGCVTYPDLQDLHRAEEPVFDLIIVNHVLEHVDDPVRFLRDLRELLTPSGKIYIDVPDLSNYSRAEDLHIAHLFHFSRSTLSAALEKAGYQVIQNLPHRPPNHPASIFAVAERRDGQPCIPKIDIGQETATWDRVKSAGRKVRLYRIKQRLRNSRFVACIPRTIRANIKIILKKVRQ